jgi:ElaB/YqjD/DUF883 family membrane-anchored ribosome-binding protein
MGEAAGEVTRWEDRPNGEDLSTDPTANDPQVEQLVGEIEVTRVEMTTTVEEIGERLDPKNIVAGAKETVRDATVGKVETMVNDAGQSVQQAGNGLVDTIKRNPVPAAMAGIGLGWLAMAARSQGQQSRQWGGTWQAHPGASGYSSSPTYGLSGQAGYGGQYGGQYSGQYGSQPGSWDTGSMGHGDGQGIGDKVGGKVGQVGDAAGGAVSSVQQTAGDVASNVGQTASQVATTVGQTAGDVASNVQQTAGQVADTVGQKAGQGAQQVQTVARDVGYNAGRALQENPLAFGAIAVAVGTAVGMALPSTRKEQEMLGPARDQLIGRAEQTAPQALSSAEQQAREQEMSSSR